MANSFYIIKQGTVSILKNSQEIRKMVAGNSFGEQALFENCTRFYITTVYQLYIKEVQQSKPLMRMLNVYHLEETILPKFWETRFN